MMQKIDDFNGKHRFLSNFFDAPVIYKNIKFKNNESAFQAMKCMVTEKELLRAYENTKKREKIYTDFLNNENFIFSEELLEKYKNINKELFEEIMLYSKQLEFSNLSPNLGKAKGRKVCLRPDWDFIRDHFMHEICFAKFTQNENLKKALLDTGDAYLEEGNTWNDTYWGVCRGVGKNHLGEILMEIRKELKQ